MNISKIGTSSYVNFGKLTETAKKKALKLGMSQQQVAQYEQLQKDNPVKIEGASGKMGFNFLVMPPKTNNLYGFYTLDSACKRADELNK